MTKNIEITSLEQLKSYAGGQIVELPDFGEGQPFVAKLKRPSLMGLIKSGKVPNSLLKTANDLFAGGATSGENGTDASEIFKVMDVICESAFVSPTWEDLRTAGIELTDEQMIAVFNYTQQGVKSLENFR